MTTTRLYYEDSYLREFSAQIIESCDGGRRLYLDRTAFYPTAGGQPNDLGQIAGIDVVDVIDEDRRIAHIVASPVETGLVQCVVDWPRRFDHMQQHTGQHLLSAVFLEMYEAETVGFHLGAEISTVDLAAPGLAAEDLPRAERRVNEEVFRNRPVTISQQPASQASGLRRPSEREGLLRIISIEDLDRSPCGGTHVRATGEIGPVLLRRAEKLRGNLRVEFLCGLRAVNRARIDFDALSGIARRFSCSIDEAAPFAAVQREALEAADKARRRAAGELAGYRGRDLYDSTSPGSDGIRRAIHRRPSGAIDEELRSLAQAFVARPRAVFLAAAGTPPAILLAVSTDAGLHAGNQLKGLLAKFGGRGGGNAGIAQGSLTSEDGLELLLAELGGLPA